MKFPSITVLLPVAMFPAALVSPTEEAKQQQTAAETATPLQCGIYMAASTLGDATNLGMYAGKDFPEGVDLQQEIAIPLLFRNWDQPDYHDTDDGQLWDRYIWEGEVANLETYDNTDTLQTKAVFVPGIGCTINSVLDMNNVESTHGSTYDTAGLHRSRDPGSGAFTPYYDTHTKSVEEIPAGSEIFAAYGDQWIPDIPGAQITFNSNLEAAEQFLRDDYYRFVQARKTQLKANVMEGLWNFTRDFPVTGNQIFSVLPRNVEWKEIEIKLEEMLEEEEEAESEGEESEDEDEEEDVLSFNKKEGDDEGPDLYDPTNMVTRHFIREQSKRSLGWLQRHGRCCDHMVARRSTLPQAGRGAFATRDLPKGTIVGYSPLIHVGLEGDKLFNIPYGTKEPLLDEEGNRLPTPPEKQDTEDDEEGYEMKDLIINYSFGHRDSTVILTPYGSMVNYINHQHGDKANIKVVWPEEEMVAHKPDWLTMNLTTLRHTIDKIGLSFDYVATRDISKGEEIFMDYGQEWETAWRQHVLDWEPLDWAEDYVHSSEWPGDEPLRTEKEQEANPYPDNLETMCVESYRVGESGRLTWLPVLRPNNLRVPCNVLARYNAIPGKKPTYRVEMFVNNKDGSMDETKDDSDDEDDDERTIVVDHVPHKWIFLVDRVKSADWHMPNAFRHTIQIPDDIMPEAWKNNIGGGNSGFGSGSSGGGVAVGSSVKRRAKGDEL